MSPMRYVGLATTLIAAANSNKRSGQFNLAIDGSLHTTSSIPRPVFPNLQQDLMLKWLVSAKH